MTNKTTMAKVELLDLAVWCLKVDPKAYPAEKVTLQLTDTGRFELWCDGVPPLRFEQVEAEDVV